MEKHTLCRRITSGWRRPIRSRIGRQIEWLSDHIGEWMFIPFDDTRQEDRPCDSEAMWATPTVFIGAGVHRMEWKRITATAVDCLCANNLTN